jgi:hypothetical protein
MAHYISQSTKHKLVDTKHIGSVCTSFGRTLSVLLILVSQPYVGVSVVMLLMAEAERLLERCIMRSCMICTVQSRFVGGSNGRG